MSDEVDNTVLAARQTMRAGMSQDDWGKEPGACFETWRSRKREAKRFALFLALTIPLLGFVVPLLIGVALGLGETPASIIAGIVASATSALLCYSMLPRLQFCLVFFPDHVQFGRGLAKREFAYLDIEAIYLCAAPVIRVRCGRKTGVVFLDNPNKPICLDLLQSFCPNAVLIDPGDHARLPGSPLDAEKALRAMERHYRRKGWRGAFGVGYFSALCAFLIWCAFDCWKGNNVVARLVGGTLFHILVGIFAVIFAGMAWNSWRTAAEIRRKRHEVAVSADLSSSMEGSRHVN
jgi:hypothetical protein